MRCEEWKIFALIQSVLDFKTNKIDFMMRE